MKKKILIGAVLLVAVLALGVTFVGSNAESIVKNVIEKYGTEAAGAPTTLKTVQLSLTDGKAMLEGFSIKNPEGFSSANAIAFDQVAVEIDPESVLGDGPLVIRSVKISQPDVSYEILADGASNLAKIQQNVATFTRTMRSKVRLEPQEGEAGAKAEPERKLIIDRLVIDGGRVHLQHALFSDKEPLEVMFPTISLSGLGRNGPGVEPGALTQAILSQITARAMVASQSKIAERVRQQGEEALKKKLDESGVGKVLDGVLGQ